MRWFLFDSRVFTVSDFLKVNDCSQSQSFFEKIKEIQELFQADELHIRRIQKRWKECKELQANFIAEFTKYKEAGKLQSEQFKYWCLLLDEIMPVLRDLTRSHREGDWKLHISAVRRALPLFFAFGGTNCSRWVPLYYEDRIALEEKFPGIYASLGIQQNVEALSR